MRIPQKNNYNSILQNHSYRFRSGSYPDTQYAYLTRIHTHPHTHTHTSYSVQRPYSLQNLPQILTIFFESLNQFQLQSSISLSLPLSYLWQPGPHSTSSTLLTHVVTHPVHKLQYKQQHHRQIHDWSSYHRQISHDIIAKSLECWGDKLRSKPPKKPNFLSESTISTFESCLRLNHRQQQHTSQHSA